MADFCFAISGDFKDIRKSGSTSRVTRIGNGGSEGALHLKVGSKKELHDGDKLIIIV